MIIFSRAKSDVEGDENKREPKRNESSKNEKLRASTRTKKGVGCRTL